MRVLAASFPDVAKARAAEAGLVREALVSTHEVRIADLGGSAHRTGKTAVLAGHFRDEVVVAARDVVDRFGGTMVVDVDDLLTHD